MDTFTALASGRVYWGPPCFHGFGKAFGGVARVKGLYKLGPGEQVRIVKFSLLLDEWRAVS